MFEMQESGSDKEHNCLWKRCGETDCTKLYLIENDIMD